MKKKLIIIVSIFTLSLFTLLSVNKVSANSRTSIYGDNIVNIPYYANGVLTTNNNLCVVNGTLTEEVDYYTNNNLSYNGGYLIIDISSSNYGSYGNKLGLSLVDNGSQRAYTFNATNGGYMVTGITNLTSLNLWVSSGSYSNFIWDVNVYHTKTLTPIDDAYNRGKEYANSINYNKQTLGPFYNAAFNGYVDYDTSSWSSMGIFNINDNIEVDLIGNSLDLNYLATYIANDILSPSITSTSTNSITMYIYFENPVSSKKINLDISGINKVSFLDANGVCYELGTIDYQSITTISLPYESNLYGMILEIDNYSEFIKTSHKLQVVDYTSEEYLKGYNNGYKSGYENAELEYENSYDDGYNDGYDDGYIKGENVGFSEGSKTNNFSSVILTIFDLPIQFFRSALDFDFFGINIYNITFSLLTLGIVIWLLKKFL